MNSDSGYEHKVPKGYYRTVGWRNTRRNYLKHIGNHCEYEEDGVRCSVISLPRSLSIRQRFEDRTIYYPCAWEAPVWSGVRVRLSLLRPLHVHHLNYNNVGHEKYEDLQALCGWHHAAEHVAKTRCVGCRKQRITTVENVSYYIADELEDALLMANWVDAVSYIREQMLASETIGDKCEDCYRVWRAAHSKRRKENRPLPDHLKRR